VLKLVDKSAELRGKKSAELCGQVLGVRKGRTMWAEVLIHADKSPELLDTLSLKKNDSNFLKKTLGC